MSKSHLLFVLLKLYVWGCHASPERPIRIVPSYGSSNEQWESAEKVTDSSSSDLTGNLKYLKPQASSEVQEITVNLAVQRILKERSADFIMRVNPNITGSEDNEAFQISYEDGSSRIKITGTTGVAAMFGLYDYLRNHCSAMIVWEGKQINLLSALPLVSYQKTILDRFRYYQNVCTESYSFVWWGFNRWEQEIDWMALHGINLPLAFTGQEEIWRRTYRSLGLKDEEILQSFTGPAFLAWWRMGNIQKWGGPPPVSYLTRKLELLKKILDRMRSFGMIPVLPAFAGNVPRNISRIFPNVTLIEHPSWNNFNQSYHSYMISPTDSLFKQIGILFLNKLIAEVGTDHIYNCDTFNENQPKDNSTKFLRAASQATYEAMTTVDPKAVWLMQSWVFGGKFWKPEFVEAYLQGVAPGNALIVDLQAERYPMYPKLSNFFGHSFIWCMLQNFGGTMNLFGSLEDINHGITTTRNTVRGNQFIGIGSCPEGINQNSVMFEFLYEKTLHLETVNMTSWIASYADRRYGVSLKNLHEAWGLLKNGVYATPSKFTNHGRSVIVKRPSLKLSEDLWYHPDDIRSVLGLMLKTDLEGQSLYQHDLVDFTRQFLQLLFAFSYEELIRSYRNKNDVKFKTYSNLLIDVMDDLEQILRTREGFLLGAWVNEAESWGFNDKDRKVLRYNALNQITLWGPNGEISDYAAKQWAGTVEYYYKPRWVYFISALNTSLTTGSPFIWKEFYRNVLRKVEIPFTFSLQRFPATPSGESVMEAKRIYRRWSGVYKKLSFRAKTKKNAKGNRNSTSQVHASFPM